MEACPKASARPDSNRHAGRIDCSHYLAILHPTEHDALVWGEAPPWDVSKYPGRAVHVHAKLLSQLRQPAVLPGECTICGGGRSYGRALW